MDGLFHRKSHLAMGDLGVPLFQETTIGYNIYIYIWLYIIYDIYIYIWLYTYGYIYIYLKHHPYQYIISSISEKINHSQ